MVIISAQTELQKINARGEKGSLDPLRLKFQTETVQGLRFLIYWNAFSEANCEDLRPKFALILIVCYF